MFRREYIHFSKEEKAMRLADWRQSGKSAWAFAKENDLVPQTFAGWVKEKSETKLAFVEIPLLGIPSPQYLSQFLIEKGDIKIHIPVTVGYGELRVVMEELRSTL